MAEALLISVETWHSPEGSSVPATADARTAARDAAAEQDAATGTALLPPALVLVIADSAAAAVRSIGSGGGGGGGEPSGSPPDELAVQIAAIARRAASESAEAGHGDEATASHLLLLASIGSAIRAAPVVAAIVEASWAQALASGEVKEEEGGSLAQLATVVRSWSR